MKKFLLLVLIFISYLKLEGASYISLYSYEYSDRTNIECVYNPARNNVDFFFDLKHSCKTTIKNFKSINNFLVNKLSLLHFNKYIVQQLNLHGFSFTFHIKFLKIPGGNFSHLSPDEDQLG